MTLNFDPQSARLPKTSSDAFDPSSAQPLRKRTLASIANDTVIETANAAAGGVSAAASFVKPGNSVSGWIDKNIVKAGEANQTDVTKAAKQKFQEEVAGADGVVGELGAAGALRGEQNMVYTLARQAQLSLKGATPKERADARKALGGLLTMHGLAAGALGLPMVTTLLAAASMVGGSDDEPWDAQVALQNMLADTFGQKPAEVMAHGMSRLTPWDISGRVGLDKPIFPDIQEGLEGQRLGESAMAAALGPVAGIGINVLKGLQDMGDGRYLRGLETMMTAVLRGPAKAWRYSTEGARDKSGIVVQDEVGAAELIGQASGFSPSRVCNSFEGKSAIVHHDRALQARRSSLVEQFAMAAMAGDDEGKVGARADIAKFNEKNPNRRILPMQLAQSVNMRQKRIREAQEGVYLPGKRLDALEAGRFAVPE